MTAAQAIKQSAQQNEIVTLGHDVTLMDQLSEESEDSVIGREVTEYWGTTEAGDEWRVHVRHDENGQS